MIKGNNPGNIRRVQGKPWVGELVPSPFTPGFVTFDTLENGYRAVLKLLNSYVTKGFNTIEKIITRWAPPSENNTAAYINFVSKDTGISPAAIIYPSDWFTLARIAKSISEIEHAGTLAALEVAALNSALGNITGAGNNTAQTAGGNFVGILIVILIALAALKQ